MTMKIFSTLLLVITLVCIIPVYGQENQAIVRWDMKDTIRHGPPETLLVYVEITTIQPNVEQGIVFTLSIENNGTQAIQILDPVDMIKVRLYRLGHPGTINLENTKPDFTICKLDTFNEQQLKEIHDNKMARRPFQTFDIDVALRDRHMKTVSDIVPWKLDRNIERYNVPQSNIDRFQAITEGKLTLEPGEQFQAVLQIIKIISNPVAPVITETGNVVTFTSPRQRNPQIVDIVPDVYSLRFRFTLWTDIEGTNRWSASSDRITIQLGEPDNQEQ